MGAPRARRRLIMFSYKDRFAAALETAEGTPSHEFNSSATGFTIKKPLQENMQRFCHGTLRKTIHARLQSSYELVPDREVAQQYLLRKWEHHVLGVA